MTRQPLVQGAGLFKTLLVMLFCHMSVTFLCVNVMFDLFVAGIPIYLLNMIGILPSQAFFKLTTLITNWTTPIVYGIPMVISGTKVYIDNVDILNSAKERDSLLLANHGSRIDWMVGMMIGHLTKLGKHPGERCRVGFVCEALIQMMPLIGWYRKIICNDIFVWRSFDKDAPTIKKNISSFKRYNEQRMLFLSPEGVIVDHDEKDMKYILQCRQFSINNGYTPFEYVLTPRYKGTTCLLDQIDGDGPFVSACLVFVRDGKLLNCKLLSPNRVIPDIYDLNQGIAGKPVSIYVHVRMMEIKNDDQFDAKARLMEEYKWKDSILKEWDLALKQGPGPSIEWFSQFKVVERNVIEIAINHVLHMIAILTFSLSFQWTNELVTIICVIFIIVTTTHTLGWMVNQASMESVPFETGIKALITFLISFQEKKRVAMKKYV